MAAKVDDGIEILSCNYDRNHEDINLAMTVTKDGGSPAVVSGGGSGGGGGGGTGGVTHQKRHSMSAPKTTTSTMSTPVPSVTPSPTQPSVNTIPERDNSRRSRRSEGSVRRTDGSVRRSEGSVKVRGDHQYRSGDHHYRVANQEEYDEELEAENGRKARVDGSVAVKAPEDFEEDDNNPYRKKVARVVVVISVIMLVMSILLVCVSLNMSKNIDDLVRSNNDMLRKTYVHTNDILPEPVLNSTDVASSNATMA